jgi:hypothetical protein
MIGSLGALHHNGKASQGWEQIQQHLDGHSEPPTEDPDRSGTEAPVGDDGSIIDDDTTAPVSNAPTNASSPTPSLSPSKIPTVAPSKEPSESPSPAPSKTSSEEPFASPSFSPAPINPPLSISVTAGTQM